jgi:multidrug efflux pump subunit AcrA (membrane-fusion protein)
VSLYGVLAVTIAWGASVTGAGWWAYNTGKDHEVAARAREDAAAMAAAQIAAAAAAEAISRIEVQRVEITQPMLREVREKTVYRECRHTPDGLRGVNAALTGHAEPAGAGELPAASAPGR